jgi:AAA+ ATPase superfamily predicted ATPase
MSAFVGREKQLGVLDKILAKVAHGGGSQPGKALLIRGRRRVGKSRLVQEFLSRDGVPNLYFTASTRATAEELRLFAEEAAASSLPGAALFNGVTLADWDGALRLLAAALPVDSPSVVVIDELPYLVASDPAFEGTLQKRFDRELAGKQVLLIGIGSDLAMMETFNEYGRPFHQRATEMVIPPLAPSEVGGMLQLSAADSFDAYLITGGLPLILDEWPPGVSVWDYLAEAVSSPTSALLVSGERSLAAEFPDQTQAREVLTAIGSGERTFANIGRAAGNPQQASLARALATLRQKRVVAVETPLSTSKSSETRYRVADPYLRFWLSFLGSHLPEIERGRGDRVLARIRAQWTSWRGRAVEPILRAALDRLPGESRPAEEGVVGSYWTRSNNPEIDVIVADRAPIARSILAVGSIKWLEAAEFDDHDYGELLMHRSQLPGADEQTSVFAVSRSGSSVPGLRVYGPEELLAAW